jgi:GT2 family glycosyltransferase
MNKDLTIVFSSYQSLKLLKIILNIIKNYKVIVVENSNDFSIKHELEKKYRNVEVIIPGKNLGLAKSYNLGIKKAKTKFVFLNNPDIKISKKTITNLLECAKKIKNFGIISPTYINEKIFKNYEVFNKKKIFKSKIYKKYKLMEVDLIDNNFLIRKNLIKKNMFDEKFFLYFETFDFSFNLKRKGIKILVSNKLKFHHTGSSSLPSSLNNFVKKTRSFHFNWGKFYFYRKNYNYFYAVRKILPNFIKAIKKIFINLFKFDIQNLLYSWLELLGVVSGMLCLRSFYRPKK